MKRYKQIDKLVAFCRPRTIAEIGTHNGTRAHQICAEALKLHDKVHYVGYDLFDDATAETDAREMNGKGAGSYELAHEVLTSLARAHQGFSFELVKGDTRKTLHGTDLRVDFVFIDGGHSVETIRGDYEAVKASRVIVFDDYYSHADTAKFGCNQIVAGVQHEIMPQEDRGKAGIGIRLAVVGYSSKWEKAINRVIEQDGHRHVSLWRGGQVQSADLVCAINTLEIDIDPDKALDVLRQTVKKRLFFVLKADLLRSLDYWKAKLTRYFQVIEWFNQGAEVVGTAIPLMATTDQFNVVGVMTADERFANVKHNVTVTDKRVKLAINDFDQHEPHQRRAVIVGYGPSLRATWDNILGEKRFRDDSDIITMSGSHDFLLRRGICPDFHVECDPRRHKAANITTPNPDVKYYIASMCHPDLTDKLKGFDLSLWHSMNGNEDFRIGDELESERGQKLVCGGGSVGLRAIALFYGLGYREFAVYGMDSSFASCKDGAPIDSADEQVMRWAGIHHGKKKAVVKVKCGERWFLTSPAEAEYARHFIDMAQRMGDAQFWFVGDGLLQEMVKLMSQEAQEKAA